LLAYADDLKLLKDYIGDFDTSKEVGLDVNTENTKCMLLSHHQNAGQNHYVKITYFENVAQFSYWGTTITNQSLIQEEIKRRSDSGNTCPICCLKM
jgi:hypothetical protein